MLKKDLDLDRHWQSLLKDLESSVGKTPADLNSVLFLIGLQELGKGPMRFSKEEKQDLIHIAVCKVLSYSGFYELEGLDEDGWPHWKLIRKLPRFNMLEQEKLLKMHILEYFDQQYGPK